MCMCVFVSALEIISFNQLLHRFEFRDYFFFFVRLFLVLFSFRRFVLLWNFWYAKDGDATTNIYRFTLSRIESHLLLSYSTRGFLCTTFVHHLFVYTFVISYVRLLIQIIARLLILNF